MDQLFDPPDEPARRPGSAGAANTAPPSPAAAYPTTATVCTTGPGVICPSATALRNSVFVIQW